MRRWKKILSASLVAVMVGSLGMTAFAEDTSANEPIDTTIKLAPCLVRLNTRPLHHIPDLCKPFFSVYASVMSFQFLYIYKSSRLKICPLP